MKEQSEINLHAVVNTVRSNIKLCIILVSLFTLAGTAYALYLPNKYVTEALLAPQTNSSKMSLPSGIGGLASLAGIDVGSLSSGDNSQIAFETLRSRGFLSKVIEKYDFKPNIIAAKGWNTSTRDIIYDSDDYNVSTKTWVRKVDYPKEQIPTTQEVHEEFVKSLVINKEKESGLISISYKHVSPDFAKFVVATLIKEINDEIRNTDKEENISGIKYLEAMLEKAEKSEIKNIFYTLIEEKNKNLLLINIREDYVFRVIDQPIIKEKKSEPKRAVFVLFSVFLGFSMTVVIVLIKNIVGSSRKSLN